MKQAFTVIVDEETTWLVLVEDLHDCLDPHFDVISITPAPTTTLQQPPPTDKNQPS